MVKYTKHIPGGEMEPIKVLWVDSRPSKTFQQLLHSISTRYNLQFTVLANVTKTAILNTLDEVFFDVLVIHCDIDNPPSELTELLIAIENEGYGLDRLICLHQIRETSIKNFVDILILDKTGPDEVSTIGGEITYALEAMRL